MQLSGECRNRERADLANSVETAGMYLRTRTQQPRAKERREGRSARFSIARANCVFSEALREDWCDEVLVRMGMVLARWLVGQALGLSPTERLKLRQQMAAVAGKKESVSPWPRSFGRKECG